MLEQSEISRRVNRCATALAASTLMSMQKSLCGRYGCRDFGTVDCKAMRKNKKPALASEWREDKEAQARAREEARLEERRALRRRIAGAIGRFVRGFVLRLGWFAAIVAGVLIAAALLSYTPTDAGFSSTAADAVPQNLCGLWGAWTSDALYWVAGAAAWWVPAALLIYGAVWLHMAVMGNADAKVRLFSSVAGLVLLFAATAGIAVINLSYLGSNMPMGAGGLVGRAVAANTAPFVGVWGATVVLAALIFAGMSLAFHFSWLTAAEAVGGAIEGFVRRIKGAQELLLARAKKVKFSTSGEVSPTAGVVTIADPALEAVETGESGESAGVADEVLKAPSVESHEFVAQEEIPMEDESAPSEVAVAPTVKKTTVKKGARIAPDAALLDRPPANRVTVKEDTLQMTSRLIESKLLTFKITAHVVEARVGPVITQYYLDLADGIKYSKVEEIKRDLARALAATSVRLIPAIPGTTYMGLEIPNQKQQRQAVFLSEVIGSRAFAESKSPLTLALGKNIAGDCVVADLAKLPHLLVGGTTGSGKSVAINAMILSLLFKCDPSQLRLVLIDPKTVEFSPYKDIPHLLCPVVVDMGKAANALNWLVQEMERRYNLMNHLSVKSFLSFNDKVRAAAEAGTPLVNPFKVTADNESAREPLAPLPYIVCFIDELADLILTNKKQVENLIVRLAQKARAAGIHLVLATQRPSVDIVTPLIKANVAARCCFNVSSRFDSSVVLDEQGAQDLLGRGDMLLKQPGQLSVTRVQGCMVSEEEIERIVKDLREKGEPDYIEGVTEMAQEETGGTGEAGGMTGAGEKDPLYDKAVALVMKENRPSTSFVQRRFSIGYNRAANLLETMERAGIVTPPNAAGKRELAVKPAGGL